MKSFFLKICTVGLIVTCMIARQSEDSNKEKVQAKTELSSDTAESLSQPKLKDVIRDLYTAVNQEDYEYAYNLWENEGAASGLSFEEFARGYQNTDTAAVKFTGNAEIHGAAGSLYAEVPVRIEAQLKSGAQQVFSGHYVLRKPNIEPQKSTGQWHIYDAVLEQ